MSRICSMTGRRTRMGHSVSHSERKTKRVFLPNLQKKRIYDPATGQYRRMRVSAAYLRTLAKRLREG